MIKIICDRCGSDVSVDSYDIPVSDEIIAYGGTGQVPLIDFGDKVVPGHTDLCPSCARELRDLIYMFTHRHLQLLVNEDKIEIVKK